MPAFLIPILISAGLGMLGGATSAFQTSKSNRAKAGANKEMQDRILAMIDKMFATDTTSAAIDDASRGIGGTMAQRGLFGSGSAMNMASRSAAAITQQDQAQKQQIEAQALQNPVFGEIADPSRFNPFLDMLGGAAMGALGGGAQAYGAQMSTNAGATQMNDWLSGLGGGGEGAARPIPIPNVGVSVAGKQSIPIPDFSAVANVPRRDLRYQSNIVTGRTGGRPTALTRY